MNLFFQTILVIVMMIFSSAHVMGQLEKVIVERYYLSDASDASDETGGGLAEGSVTYRIFVDLAPGTELKSIYGDAGHPFIINSTNTFFNNVSDGQSFAKDFIKNRYLENTVALDTWLTIGQTAKKQGELAYYGILKEQDTNGSFIGGTNNDGGSAQVADGLLINSDVTIGLPLTTSDGMDTSSFNPTGWFSNGVLNFSNGLDSTIFGSIVQGNQFQSENFLLSCAGVFGQVADSNQIIIAQLTTQGELSFVLNLEVEYSIDGVPTIVKYVGTNSINGPNEVYSPFLKYPLLCGCDNPEYLEFDPTVACYLEGSCLTPFVIGCMDTLACNYNPLANFQVDELCCYPGLCNNRNIEDVCPQLKGNSFDFSLFPNPASESVTLNVISGVQTSIEYFLYNYHGMVMQNEYIQSAPLNYSIGLELSNLNPGIYQVRVVTEIGEQNKLFVKL